MANATIRSFSAGALLKIGCMGLGTFWVLIGLLFGLLALTGVSPVTLNDQPTYGIGGFFGGLLIGLFFAGLSTLAFMLGGLVARYVPKLRDARVELEDAVHEGDPPTNDTSAN